MRSFLRRGNENLLAASGFKSVRREYFLYLPERLFRTFGGVEQVFSKLPFGGQFAVLAQTPRSL